LGTVNRSDREELYIRDSANRDFKKLLLAIREIFPPEQYSLIAKLWPNPELRQHTIYLVENYFDAVTLINSLKAESPKPFEGIKKGKLPQMSGLKLRQYRDEALYLAGEIRCKLPIFASGGVAVEAIRKPDGFNGNLKLLDDKCKQKNVEEGVADILKCFQLGASYVQLGTVAHIGGYDTMARIMMELKGI
jgi:dihydroorotate dehydrogenase